jgi:hypothetical protein
MDSDAEIENHERQLEQTLLEQLKIAKSIAEAKQFCNDSKTGNQQIFLKFCFTRKADCSYWKL